MAPKQSKIDDKPADDEQELMELIELLCLEDAAEKISDKDNQTLSGYFQMLEDKTRKHVMAYKSLKKEMKRREKDIKKEQTKKLRDEKKEMDKETKKNEKATLITVYVRLNSQTLTLTFGKNITLGEFRRMVVAMWNSMNPHSPLTRASSRGLHIYLNGVDISNSPRKEVASLGFVNEATIHAELPSSAVASSSTAPINDPTIDEIDSDETESDEPFE